MVSAAKLGQEFSGLPRLHNGIIPQVNLSCKETYQAVDMTKKNPQLKISQCRKNTSREWRPYVDFEKCGSVEAVGRLNGAREPNPFRGSVEGVLRMIELNTKRSL